MVKKIVVIKIKAVQKINKVDINDRKLNQINQVVLERKETTNI